MLEDIAEVPLPKKKHAETTGNKKGKEGVPFHESTVELEQTYVSDHYPGIVCAHFGESKSAPRC